VASTAKYTTAAQVKSHLPRVYSTGDLPDTTDTTYTSLATHIIKSSREIDSALGLYFCTFNATDHATYPTPQVIQDIATWITLGRCYPQLAVGGRNTAYIEAGQAWATRAQAALDEILGTDRGNRPRFWIINDENVASETLTFGVGGQYDLNTLDAFINIQSNLTSADVPVLIEDSVKVTAPSGFTQYGYNRDFSLYFHTKHQKWVFRDHGSLHSQAGAKTIQYQFSWRRQNERQVEGWANPALAGGW
jgi:hypothetical protein